MILRLPWEGKDEGPIVLHSILPRNLFLSPVILERSHFTKNDKNETAFSPKSLFERGVLTPERILTYSFHLRITKQKTANFDVS